MEASKFYAVLGRMLLATDEEALVANGLGESEHNEIARVLRGGLAVSSFSHLEAFLEARFGDVAGKVAVSAISYGEFPEALRRFFTLSAVQGLANRAGLKNKQERLGYVELQLPLVAGVFANPQVLTALGFSPKGSNVLSADLRDALKAFSVEEPWEYLKDICSSVGAGELDLASSYSRINENRNNAAHNPEFDIPSGDLKSHLRSVLDIAVATHVTLAHLGVCTATSGSFADFVSAKDQQPRMRFIDREAPGSWVERASNSARVIKRYVDENVAVLAANARSGNPIIVVRDESQRPIRIYSN